MEAKDARRSSSRSRGRKEVVTFLAGDACRYPVVRDAAARMGWKLIGEESSAKAKRNCNVIWVDVSVVNDFFHVIQPWQICNHFPGMANIARKTRLAQNLEAMKRKFPRHYSYYPITYVLPKDMAAFRTLFSSDGRSKYTFIIKPDGGAKGKGIFLTRHLADICRLNSPFVAQRYIRNPLLIDNKKFDLRIYVLVTSCAPLRIYLFRDGLVRLCTEEFVQPNENNINDRCIHLTNYSLNRHSDKFERDADSCGDSGSKRSICWLLSWLREQRGDVVVDRLWCKIGDICVKTVMSILPTLAREYQELFGVNASLCINDETSTGDECIRGSRCFEILGFDIMIDAKLNPHLIEVNHLPSFATDSPLDEAIKSRVVQQALGIVRARSSDRRVFEKLEKNKSKDRLSARKDSSVASSIGRGSGSDMPCENDTSETIDPVGRRDSLSRRNSLPPTTEALITEIYKTYAPEKLDKVKAMMSKYRGYEDWLLSKVREKYCSPPIGGDEPYAACGHDNNASEEDLHARKNDDVESNTFSVEEAILSDYNRIYPPQEVRSLETPPFSEFLEYAEEEDLKKLQRLTVPLHRLRTGDEDCVKSSINNTFELSRADSWINGNIHLRRASQPMKILQPPTQKQIEAADRLSRGFHVDESLTKVKPLFDFSSLDNALAQANEDDACHKWRLVNRVRQDLEDARERRKRNEDRFARRGQIGIAVQALDLDCFASSDSRYFVDLNAAKGLHGNQLHGW